MHGTSVLIGRGCFERDSLIADGAERRAFSLLIEQGDASVAPASSLAVTVHPALHTENNFDSETSSWGEIAEKIVL
jgi:hypothetical protein